jgi:hypothetical protein
LLAQAPDPVDQHAPIQLDLLFARTAANANSAPLTLEVSPAPDESRLQVLEPRKLNLQLAFVTAGAPGKDVKDQFGSIHDGNLPQPVQVALLNRRYFMAEKDKTDPVERKRLADVIGLSRPDTQGRVDTRSAHDEPLDWFQTRRAGKRVELVKGLGAAATITGCDANEQASRVWGLSVQFSSPSCWMLTGRPGTTVEIACL